MYAKIQKNLNNNELFSQRESTDADPSFFTI